MKALTALLLDEFTDSFAPISTLQPLHSLLKRAPEVREVYKALQSQEVTIGQLEQFLRDLLADFVPKRRFHGDMALAALAVALTAHGDEFADTYIRRLAALDAQELPLSRRIAKLALAERAKLLAGVTARRADFRPAMPIERGRIRAMTTSVSSGTSSPGLMQFPAVA